MTETRRRTWLVTCSVCHRRWEVEAADPPIGTIAPPHAAVRSGVEQDTACVGSGRVRVVRLD